MRIRTVTDMAGDARDLPLALVESTSDFVVFSHQLGLIAQDATATDSVRHLVDHLRRFPGSDAAIFRRSPDAWRVF